MEKIPWFKFYTGFFKRQSMVLISGLNNSETIMLVLIKLICMATEINDRGYVYITPERPYQLRELASYMGKSVKVMENILQVLKDYGEIEIESDGMIFVTSWSEEQNVDRLQMMKEKQRETQKKYRMRKKQADDKALYNGDITRDITVIKSYAVEEEEYEYEKEYEKKEEYEYEDISKNFNEDDYVSVISYFNNKFNKDYNYKDKYLKNLIAKKLSEGYKVEDCIKVIDNKESSWKNTEYEKFLRPETLFGDKFNLYLNEGAAPKCKSYISDYDNELDFRDFISME